MKKIILFLMILLMGISISFGLHNCIIPVRDRDGDHRYDRDRDGDRDHSDRDYPRDQQRR